MQVTPATTVRNLQVILFALVGGLVVLMVVIMSVLMQVKPGGFIGAQGPKLGELPLITTVLCGIAVMNLVISLGLPAFVTRTSVGQLAKTVKPVEVEVEVEVEVASWDTEYIAWQEKVPEETMTKLLGIFQAEKIIAGALCEAGGMLAAVAYLLEANWVAVVLLFLCIAAMLMRLPTLDGVNRWLLTQVTRLHDR